MTRAEKSEIRKFYRRAISRNLEAALRYKYAAERLEAGEEFAELSAKSYWHANSAALLVNRKNALVGKSPYERFFSV